MTWNEIQQDYIRGADDFARRMRQLRRQEKEATGSEKRRLYARRMALLPILRDLREKARQVEPYTHRGGEYHGNE